mmetsp:Transcript_36056/g.40133  ORF Transcript_36056/g.40133 Transcript_36056/m.40133 type:complete len:811 (-) Transcript_36056:54-2486(-)
MTEITNNDGNKSITRIFSSSCAATVFMAGYVFFALFNLYGLMYPLTKVNLDDFEPDSFIRPLWDTKAEMTMKVYLSTKEKFDEHFLASEYETIPSPEQQKQHGKGQKSQQDTVLMWKEDINTASLSKTFLISSLDCIGNDDGVCNIDNDGDIDSSSNNGDDAPIDASLRFAQEWLDEQDKALLEDDGSILSTIQSAAGKGIESTSLLLTAGQGISKKINSFLVNFGIIEEASKNDKEEKIDIAASKGILHRSNIFLPDTSPMWKNLVSNSTIYIHVVVVRQQYHLNKPETTLNETLMALRQASGTHSLLLGTVDLVKYDIPNHLGKPSRILFYDLFYLFRKHILRDEEVVKQGPPWDMAVAKPKYYAAYEHAQQMKVEGRGYPYWKPEVAIKYLIDEESYPMDLAHVSGMDFVRVKKSNSHPSGIAHIPTLHVDEIGMTSDKYIPINETVTSLPLRISFDRSDMEEEQQHGRAKTATAGGISPARWRLLQHLSKSLESQRELGFEQSDIDDLRRLIADTNVTLLGITVLASALHMLFEFLTFKSEVSFWQNNSDLTGLSVRSLFLDMVGQFIIILFLIEQETSLLITVTSGFGLLVALWKCVKAAGLAIVPLSDEEKRGKYSIINFLPRVFGYQFKATRLESSKGDDNKIVETSTPDLRTLTIEADRQATTWLGSLLLPIVFVYTLYSFVIQEHVGWYSWLVTSASTAVYAFGFVLMTPQLFLNYKMKSVAHLPWRVLVYKSLNTFIDDLFSFIIRMPTMARISCFRDDVVFFIYLYQRWLYPVDVSRPVEGGGAASTTETIVSETKKNQ